MNRSTRRIFVVCALAGLLGLPAAGQDEVPELPPGVVLPPGFRLAGAVRVQTPGATNNAPADAKAPEDARLAELLKLKFNRTPSAVLGALAEQFDPAKSASTNEVEQFQQHVVSGDWAAVGNFLGALTNDHGKQVYRYLLRELPNSARPAPEAPEPGRPMRPQGPGPANNPPPTLLAGDVMTLADIAPHELDDEDVRLLGQLLKRLLERGDALEPVLARLDRGARRLGGAEPDDRRRAAELLVAADRLVEAGRFLPAIEVAREKEDWPVLDLRARQLAALGSKEKDSQAFERAWEVNQFILSSSNSAAANREAALQRCLELMPLMASDTSTNWLRRKFETSPGEGLALLAAVSETVQRGMGDRATGQRQQNLALQKQVVDTFLDVADPAQPHWRAALNLLAQGWMLEAAWTRQRFQSPRNLGPQYDPYGNMVRSYNDPNQTQPVPVDQIVAGAPGEPWLAQLDEALRIAVRVLLADLNLKAEETDVALRQIEALAALQPEAAVEPANEFLHVWARQRSSFMQPNIVRYGPMGPIYAGAGPAYGSRGPGASLTRAMQVRNIAELSGFLGRLQALRLPTLDDDAVVGAFSAAHSPAEVFRVEDMEAVFGPINRLKLETLAALAQTMRERLAAQWRQPRVQQEAKTQRTDKQIQAEVLRGYEVVLKLIEEGLQREANHWQLTLARSAAYFDLAEFQYGKKVDLAIYVEKRDEAFKGFERAAALYASALDNIEEKEQSPAVYQQWFNANLGASDLAYVTRQVEPETNQLQRIRDAILSLPGGAAERHMAVFAKGLGESAGSLPPDLKPRYLRAGLRVAGNHPAAEDARKLATYYDDLIQEIELVVRIDGDAVIGHSRPFGVFVSLRHTADIERETGGFARYLRNNKRSPAYYNPYGQQQRNFVEDFDRQAREKLIDTFEVKSITFLDEKVESRGAGRPGWRETPLAYLLLQAKDGSVDRLPAMQMDLDFFDTRGPVVLPVESQIVLLDARPERVASRPVAGLEVTQILDEREVSEGRLTLEVKAVGKGILPELAELLKTNFAGIRIEEISDQGLSVARIDTEGDAVAAVTERNWLLKLAVEGDAPSSLVFQFPPAAEPGAKVAYKRYADADLVEVKPEIAVAGFALRPRPVWPWVGLGVGILLGAGALTGWLRRRKPATEEAALRYQFPEPATVFSVIGLLRRMRTDDSLDWSETDRSELDQTIRQLETHFFDRTRNGHPEPDLRGIGRRWVEHAANGR